MQKSLVHLKSVLCCTVYLKSMQWLIQALHCRARKCSFHCEIFGSYLQQHNQHHVFSALFYAEPHSQTEANDEESLLWLIPGYKLTASEVTYITLFSCRIGTQRLVVVRLIVMPGCSNLGDIQ